MDFAAPLPLGYHQALERAIELRSLGPVWTWQTIADAMRIYHGFDRSASWWRRQLWGRVQPRPRGITFRGRVGA